MHWKKGEMENQESGSTSVNHDSRNLCWEDSSRLCRTVVGPGSTGTSSDVGEKRFKQHRTVIVKGADGDGIRTKRGTVAFIKKTNGGTENVMHAARTVVMKGSLKEMMALRRRSVKNVKTKSFGRVRTQVVLERETCDSEDELYGCTIVNLRDDRNGDRPGTSSKGRIVRRRRRRRDNDGRKSAKRRTRLSVSIDKFKLFGTNGTELEDRVRRGLGKGWDAGMTEQEKFCKSIRASEWCTVSLQEAWRNERFLRCSGGMRRDQKFICVATVRLKRLLYDGGSEMVLILSVLIEEESRKVRMLTIRRQKHWDTEGTVVLERSNFLCSCDINRTVTGIGDSKCWHIRCLQQEVTILSKFQSIVECGFRDDHGLYFGDALKLKEKDCNGDYTFDVDGGCGIIIIDNGLIAIQLDTLTMEELMDKGCRIAKRWSPWICVDPAERLIVSVIWRPVRSGEATRMICGMCRSDVGKKCRHELCCEQESLLTAAISSGSELDDEDIDECDDGIDGDESGEAVGMGSVNVEQASHHRAGSASVPSDADIAQASSTPVDPEDPGDDDEPGDPEDGEEWNDAGDESECDVDVTNDEAVRRRNARRKERFKFLPTGPTRSFMFCRSERRKAESLCDLIETVEGYSGVLLFADPNGQQCTAKLSGTTSGRQRCFGKRKQSDADKPRKVSLITLTHGSVGILVTDCICTECGKLNYYNGYGHGLFPAISGIAFTVELIYYWISEMCGSTRAFRSVYSTTKKL